MKLTEQKRDVHKRQQLNWQHDKHLVRGFLPFFSCFEGWVGSVNTKQPTLALKMEKFVFSTERLVMWLVISASLFYSDQLYIEDERRIGRDNSGMAP